MSIFQNLFGDQISAKSSIKTIPADKPMEMEDVQIGSEQFYFDLRLCEMYLRNQAEGGRQYVPRALAITECLYGQQQSLVLPVAVGDHILAEIGALIDNEDGARAITFSNCPLAGPMPYRGGDIGFFSGLYRVEAGNIVDSAINLIADVTGNLGLNLTKYLDIGRQVATRLPSLLGTDNSDWRLGHYAPIYKPDDGFFDRHLVLIGDDGVDFDPGALEIKQEDTQDSLYIREGGQSRPFDARDYLLIKLRSAPVRNDYERFDFHQRFDTIKKYLIEGNLAQAEWARNDLNQEIGVCPDLTGDHQLDLILMYEMRVGKWKEKLGLVAEYEKADHKGGGDDSGDDLRSGAIASAALDANLSDGTINTLENVRKSWEEFDDLIDLSAENEYSSDSVNQFLRKMSEKRVSGSSASDLVKAVQIRSITGER